MKDLKPKCIVYGCADPEAPEPYDPEYFCKNCAKKEQKTLEESIKKHGEGEFYNEWWQRPDFVNKALKKTGYEMERKSDNTIFILKKSSNLSTPPTYTKKE